MAIECSEIVLGCSNYTRICFVDTDGTPISMTGERIRVAISRDFNDPPVILKDSDNGDDEIEILASPEDNCVIVKILPADTEDLECGTYCRSIEVTFNSLTPPRCVIPLIDSVDIVTSGFVAVVP